MKAEEGNTGHCLFDGIEMSEPGNGTRLKNKCAGLLRYVPKVKAWYVYENGCWIEDVEGVKIMVKAKAVPQTLFDIASAKLAEFGPEPVAKIKDVHGNVKPENWTAEHHAQHEAFLAEQELLETWHEKVALWNEAWKWAEKSNTESQLRHSISLSKDLRGMTMDIEDFDKDPNLLNLTNGTFNFLTGELQDHDPNDLMTKQCPVAYVPEATCHVWDTSLRTWQPAPDMRRFLQSIIGSAATGEPVQKLYVSHGYGANGKDTFFKPIQDILGPYAVVATEAMIVDHGNNEMHDEDLAKLQGCRLLVFPETNAGDKINEARIKNMTGGGKFRARKLYGKPFEISPTHTAFVHTNHEPRISGTDNGIWRRMVLIPWDVTIPENERDTELDNKLAREHEGILKWIIDGAMDWKRHGFSPPPNVRAAGEEYRQSQDHVGRFLNEKWEQIIRSDGSVDNPKLRIHYVQWCEDEGIRPWSHRALSQEMERRGFKQQHRNTGSTTIRVWNASEAWRKAPGLTLVTLNTPLYEYEKINTKYIEKEGYKSIGDTTVMVGSVTSVRPALMQPEPSVQSPKSAKRSWLTESGFPIPPTDEELNAYWDAQAAEWQEEQNEIERKLARDLEHSDASRRAMT